MKAVWILWVDSFATSGWVQAGHSISQLECETLGWLVAETDESITVAASYAQINGSVEGPITIPKAAIVQRKDIVWQ